MQQPLFIIKLVKQASYKNKKLAYSMWNKKAIVGIIKTVKHIIHS